MNRKHISKLACLAMAAALAFSAVPATTLVAQAEEATETHSADRTITVRAYGLVNGKYNSTLTNSRIVPDEKKTITITDDEMWVTEVAPTKLGYRPFFASYTSGYSTSMGARYFHMVGVKNIKTGVMVYNPKVNMGAANYSTNTEANMLEGSDLYINLYYAPITYTVEYAVDDETIATDANSYSIEGDTTVDVNVADPVKEGYTFTGWALEESGKTYVNGDVIDLADVYAATSTPDKADLKANSNPTVSTTLTLVAQFEEIPVPTKTVSANSKVTNSWSNNVQADITVTNTSDETLKSWKAELPMNAKINQIWNAEIISCENGVYTIGCPSWKQNLEPGESYTFGIIAEIDGTEFVVGEANVVSEEAAPTSDDYAVSFNKSSQWAGGYVGSLTIANATSQSLNNWTLEFDLDDEISGMWNGKVVSHEGNHYVVENAGYNATIYPNSSVEIGFMGIDASDISNVSLTVIK